MDDDGSGCHGQILFDDGEKPPGVEDYKQLTGQFAHGVNQIDAVHICRGSLVVNSGESLDAIRVGSLNVRNLIHDHAECTADRGLEQ
jgi:hypothetical protein